MSNKNKQEEKYEFKLDSSKQCLKLIGEFCESLKIEKNFSEHTLRNYKNDLIAFLIWCDINSFDVKSLNYREIRYYLSELDNAKYARTTINRHLSSLRSFYK